MAFAIDQEKLIDDITQALVAKDFDAKIEASSAARWHLRLRRPAQREQYKTIGSLLQIPHPIKQKYECPSGGRSY